MEALFYFVEVDRKAYHKNLQDGTISFFSSRVPEAKLNGTGYRVGAVEDDAEGVSLSFWNPVAKEKYETLTKLVGRKRFLRRMVTGTRTLTVEDFVSLFTRQDLTTIWREVTDEAKVQLEARKEELRLRITAEGSSAAFESILAGKVTLGYAEQVFAGGVVDANEWFREFLNSGSYDEDFKLEIFSVFSDDDIRSLPSLENWGLENLSGEPLAALSWKTALTENTAAHCLLNPHWDGPSLERLAVHNLHRLPELAILHFFFSKLSEQVLDQASLKFLISEIGKGNPTDGDFYWFNKSLYAIARLRLKAGDDIPEPWILAMLS